MAVFTQHDPLPAFKNPVLTIGTFDGVHLGHQAILKEVAEFAAKEEGESVLITFEPHPRKVLFPDEPLQLLTTLEEKIRLIEDTGIDHIVVAPFTKEFAGLSAEDYITQFLVAKFHPHSIVIGYDHRFGHDRTGNLELLREYSGLHGFMVHEIPAQMIEHASVSSTRIRKALEAGHVTAATQMLGRHYTLEGTVVKGAQLGRTLGFPTANIKPDDALQLIPARGVYAVRVLCNNIWHDGMMNIGMRPTVTKEISLHLEVHLFDFNDDLYGQKLRIAFIGWLREEQKFESLDALKAQLSRDAEEAKGMLRM